MSEREREKEKSIFKKKKFFSNKKETKYEKKISSKCFYIRGGDIYVFLFIQRIFIK